jgi:EPS-associated MarR family transcriptional regulator
LFNIEQYGRFISMAKALKSINPDVHFRVLHLLEEEPELTQRELAKKLGISLGGVNYCLRALIEIGHIKVGNFSKNPNKSVYLYLLTPKGIAEKAELTRAFLKRKMLEYQALKKEIESVRSNLRG